MKTKLNIPQDLERVLKITFIIIVIINSSLVLSGFVMGGWFSNWHIGGKITFGIISFVTTCVSFPLANIINNEFYE